jgi:hypothetical protein
MKILPPHLSADYASFGSAALPRRVHDRSLSSAVAGSPADSVSSRAIKDTLEVSAAAESQLTDAAQQPGSPEEPKHNASAIEDTSADGNHKKSPSDASTIGELSEEEQEVVDELQARDREVRTHEQAHLSAAGPYAKGGPTYDYQQGPDGQRYAVGGQVSIDTSPVDGDPEATIAKARVVRAAALAPAEPSAQDRAVAAAATKLEAQALQELREKQAGEATDDEPADGEDQLKASAEFTRGILLDLIA